VGGQGSREAVRVSIPIDMQQVDSDVRGTNYLPTYK